MQRTDTVSRVGAWLVLFAGWASWAAFAAFFAAFLASAYLQLAIVERAADIGAAAAGWQLTALSLAQLLVWAVLLLFLARKLGEGAPRTAWGTLLLAWLVYYIVGILPSGLVQGVMIGQLQDRPDLIAPLASGWSLFWSCAVLPLPVWLVAASHSGGSLGLRAILAYLLERGIGLWLLFIAFQIVSLMLGLGVGRLLGDAAETTGATVARQLFEAFRAISIVLFYIMAYREIAAAQPAPREDVFR